MFAVLLTAVLLDSLRPPDKQISVPVYTGAVRLYQSAGRRMLGRMVRCRFVPTCSEYSIEAVRRYGIRHGLLLTVRRIASCRKEIPVGTLDPVP